MSKVLKSLQFAFEFAKDCLQTLRFNSYSPLEDRNRRLFYHLIIETHTIEKGLSLPNPRPLFGQTKITNLIQLAKNYDAKFSSFPLEMLNGALKEYLRFHEEKGISEASVLDAITEFLEQHPEISQIEASGGTKDATEVYQGEQPAGSIIEFLQSRYSCRRFDKSPLDTELIRDIISLAQRVPSQCNRQTSRVHYYSDQNQISELLQLQAGSGGFREDVGNLFIVTSESTGWGGARQRNQAFVDGALFSMFLMMTCHAHQIASCPLNLAKLNAEEQRIKKTAKIPNRERLIMMIAIGKTATGPILAASSPRLPLDQVLTIH